MSNHVSEVPTRIIRAMGGVPLAIEQARAMIKQGIPVQDFLGHYETQYQKVMAHKPARSAWDYEKNMSIISVFNMLLMRLHKDGDAENLLAFASCFGPRPVSVNLIGQVHQPVGSTVTSHSGVFKERHTSEIAWLHRFGHDRLAFQLATGKLEGLCLLKLRRDGDGNIVTISLHDSISRWRFETLASDLRTRWIIAAAYTSSKCLPENIVDQGSQMKLLPLVRHFCAAIRRYVEPQKLEAPGGEFGHQYGYLMTRFAPLYLNSGYTVEGEYVFLQATEYQKIHEASSWPKDRRSLLLLKGLAMMFSKNGKTEDAVETTRTLHDASMKLLGLGDQITSWAAARLPTVTDRKIRYAESEQRAAIASRGEKLSSTSPGRTPNELLEIMTQDEPLDCLPSRGPRSTSGYTALTLAASNGDTEGILLELDQGVDIDSCDLNSVTALETASLNGHAFTVHLLLSHGANVNSGGRLWGNALHIASCGGHTAVVDILLKNGVDVNAKSYKHATALQYAAFGGHRSITQLLLNDDADIHASGSGCSTALNAASYRGHTAVAEMLLSNGADVNFKDERFGTALYAASHFGHTAVAEMLLSNGADVNVKGETFGNALCAASRNGYTAVAEVLLSKGADVDAEGGRSLLLAISNGHRDMVNLLLANGADVNAEYGGFGTALQAARSLGQTELIAILIAAGARDSSRGSALFSRLSNSISARFA